MIYLREQTEFDIKSLPHNKYDIITKDTVKTYPQDILQSVLARTDFTFLEFVDSEFVTVDVRQADSLIKVRLDDEIVLVHIEFQVSDSTSSDMVRRNVGYLGRCYEMYGLPILSHVVYLRPNAGRNDLGGYIQDIPDYRFIVEYKVIRLIELEGESVFETPHIGLVPFAPLMKPPAGMDKFQWAVQCNEKTKSLSLTSNVRSNLLVSQWVMSGLVHPHQAIADFIQEGIVQESSVYQHWLETTGKEHFERGMQQGTERGIQQGIEQGERQSTLESVLRVLEYKFNSISVRLFQPMLQEIKDVQLLKQLLNEALKAQTLEEFIQHLETIESDLD